MDTTTRRHHGRRLSQHSTVERSGRPVSLQLRPCAATGPDGADDVLTDEVRVRTDHEVARRLDRTAPSGHPAVAVAGTSSRGPSPTHQVRRPLGARAALLSLAVPLTLLAAVHLVDASVRGIVLLAAWIVVAVLFETTDRRRRPHRPPAPSHEHRASP